MKYLCLKLVTSALLLSTSMAASAHAPSNPPAASTVAIKPLLLTELSQLPALERPNYGQKAAATAPNQTQQIVLMNLAFTQREASRVQREGSATNASLIQLDPGASWPMLPIALALPIALGMAALQKGTETRRSDTGLASGSSVLPGLRALPSS